MKILFVGDVMLGRLVNDILKQKSPDYPWGDTLPIFNSADLRICNLECVISDVGNPWSISPKVFHFRTDEKNIQSLLSAKIDMVSIANNHVLDYEYEGLLRMLKVLGNTSIKYAGSGSNALEAVKPAICHVNSLTIGLIAFTDNEPDWQATDKTPGVFYVPINEEDGRAKYLFELIKKTKCEVDILIVSTHWGPNWGYEPPREHVSFAHSLIDAGADVIFGHSGHIFRGIEFYNGKAIFYCTGDFIDDYAVDEIEKNDESFIFMLEITNRTIKGVSLYPTMISHFQARRAVNYEQESIVVKMQKLCNRFNTKTYWHEEERYLEAKA